MTIEPKASGPPAKPQPQPARVVHTQAPAGRRTGQGEFVGAQRFYDQKLVSAKQHFAVLDQLLKAAAEKIDAAKPGDEADVQYEADMVRKHLFLYNEDLAIARDLWLRSLAAIFGCDLVPTLTKFDRAHSDVRLDFKN